jgi:hypothetical protein
MGKRSHEVKVQIPKHLQKKNNCKKYVLLVSKTTLRTARFIENTNTVWIVFQEKY